MKIGILGSGQVGQTLAHGFKDLNHEVMIASRDGKIIDGWDGVVGKFVEVAKDSELIVLCVKGSVAEAVVKDVTSEIMGKIVIDTTNPISDTPPENGVIKFFTNFDQSLFERLVKLAPKAKFVKAFNSAGAAVMVKPNFKEGKPTMFICGNDEGAKKEVTQILTKFGWDTEDMGKAASARAIEPLCILWCIPGFLRNDWNHAFKMLK